MKFFFPPFISYCDCSRIKTKRHRRREGCEVNLLFVASIGYLYTVDLPDSAVVRERRKSTKQIRLFVLLSQSTIRRCLYSRCPRCILVGIGEPQTVSNERSNELSPDPTNPNPPLPSPFKADRFEVPGEGWCRALMLSAK